MTGTGGFTIDLLCESCNTTGWDTIPKAEATWENRWDCPSCGTEKSVKRIMSAPRIMKASYPDGVKRSGFAELKEAAALEEEAMNSEDYEKRQGIKKEIRKMGIQTTI